jgi:hypothetical protein
MFMVPSGLAQFTAYMTTNHGPFGKADGNIHV